LDKGAVSTRFRGAATSLPVFIKEIRCAEDTVLAAQGGAAVVVASNRGGRVLDAAPG
jgi:isopentenyl diphosphate isomerase/L-lactate dehydrogenase-like FMN-dependent dehydrogenase